MLRKRCTLQNIPVIAGCVRMTLAIYYSQFFGVPPIPGHPTSLNILCVKTRFCPLRNNAAIIKLIENRLHTKHDAAKKTHFSEYFCDRWLCAHVACFQWLAANFSIRIGELGGCGAGLPCHTLPEKAVDSLG